MTNRALFDFNADGEDQVFVATHGESVTATLRIPSTASSWMLQVWDPDREEPTEPITGNPPRASKSAPLLTLTGATSGHLVAAASPSAEITFTIPGSGTHSWIFRSLIDGGYTNGVLDPDKICQRGVVVIAGSVRKPVATETQEFENESWAGLICDLIDALDGGGGGGGGPGYGLMYVHQASGIAVEDQDGSAAKPFASFMAAHNALPSDGGVIYVLLANGTVATGDETIAFTKPLAVIAKSVLVQSWGDNTHQVASSSHLYVEGMGNTLDEGGGNGVITAANVTAKRCVANFQASNDLDLEDCTLAGGSPQFVGESARLSRCLVAQAITAGTSSPGECVLEDCVISAHVTTFGTEAYFSSCRWTAGTRHMVFAGSAGVMFVDAMSNYWWKAATETLTNGTKTIQADIL